MPENSRWRLVWNNLNKAKKIKYETWSDLTPLEVLQQISPKLPLLDLFYLVHVLRKCSSLQLVEFVSNFGFEILHKFLHNIDSRSESIISFKRLALLMAKGILVRNNVSIKFFCSMFKSLHLF